MNMRDEMRQTGYSKEDEYFHRKDQELIEQMRKAVNDRKKALEEKHQGQAHWMKCPKCGSDLKEELIEQVVRVDTCSECGGQYFDQGELDLLIKSRLTSALRGGA
jgi:demethoxyubiquinone hydroxylase (CLK1/Coq7/Cat5 family)